jgi:hypothetical protein
MMLAETQDNVAFNDWMMVKNESERVQKAAVMT